MLRVLLIFLKIFSACMHHMCQLMMAHVMPNAQVVALPGKGMHDCTLETSQSSGGCLHKRSLWAGKCARVV